MVSAILIIAIGLGTAFLLGFLRADAKGQTYALTLAGLATMAWIAPCMNSTSVTGAICSKATSVFPTHHRPKR